MLDLQREVCGRVSDADSEDVYLLRSADERRKFRATMDVRLGCAASIQEASGYRWLSVLHVSVLGSVTSVMIY